MIISYKKYALRSRIRDIPLRSSDLIDYQIMRKRINTFTLFKDQFHIYIFTRESL